MSQPRDVEGGTRYKEYEDIADSEREGLLSNDTNTDTTQPTLPQTTSSRFLASQPRFTLAQLASSFAGGIALCLGAQLAVWGPGCYSFRPRPDTPNSVHQFAPPYVGSTEVHNFPPASPTNAFPELFPTNVGYAGGTPTGAEPALIATAPSYPLHTGAAQLVLPTKLHESKDSKESPKNDDFNLFRSWGNLSPWYSVGKGAFGVESGPEPPETCRITGLHLLHRHGARYPTSWANYGGPASLASKLHKSAADWEATGKLSFLNDWTYKLGEEVLTPFGRQQLFDLGVSMRLKYGFLLKNFTESNTIPVFRTESQDRMLASAMNFAIGFFGYPFDGQYQQLITIEASGFNNTFAPYETCPNAQTHNKSNRSLTFVKEWTSIYLKHAHKRLQHHLRGFKLTIEDVYTMQQMCAYETVALGYSKFCELFTQEEWEGFNYALDLVFWYDSAFGSPVARVQGLGYIQELVARLTETPIETHNSSTNATLHTPDAFPFGHSLYVDATHEVVVLNVITALNLSTFAASGPLPSDHIPANRSFKVSELAPFATNMQFQLLACESEPGPQIRIVINDGVAPLTGIKTCPEHSHGLCPVDAFVEAQKEIIRTTDWIHDCHGDWTVPPGTEWSTTTGDAPKW
ncbi:phosphoglycerate mutase-like protein [Leucogyrophana mollusca]|uniref:Phosphoglycerate mutase-like protein n=1 Tax=Leucogyrophana mollusca TaxID=85980 RepID=A0ACB8BUH0_9AGAM|nr:phosphoglycerate mutase-like protein [Leucogyrophana mollusca]